MEELCLDLYFSDLGKIVKGQDLVTSNLKLVIKIAMRYNNRELYLPDLIQEGNTGLIRAADLYDPRKGYKFSTYASWWIRQAIIRAIANYSQTIRNPVHIINDISKYEKICETLVLKLGREPDRKEIAKEADKNESWVILVEEAKKNQFSESLDGLRGDNDDSNLYYFLGASTDSAEKHCIRNEERLNIVSMLERLPKIQREVFKKRYLEDLELEEISELLGISKYKVKGLLSSAKRTLRSIAKEE